MTVGMRDRAQLEILATDPFLKWEVKGVLSQAHVMSCRAPGRVGV